MPLFEGDNETLRALTRDLLTPDAYSRSSPLMTLLQKEVKTLATQIAIEVVQTHPELRNELHRKVTETVAAIMENDWTFNDLVVKAVTEVLVDQKSRVANATD
jgi:hypothetical protein